MSTLSPRAAQILANVQAAMQDAEEIWGPEDYAPLMAAIRDDASARLAVSAGVSNNSIVSQLNGLADAIDTRATEYRRDEGTTYGDAVLRRMRSEADTLRRIATHY